MGLRKLAEAVILQSMEDLFDDAHREENIRFFTSPDFRVFAEMAGMDTEDKLQFLKLLKRFIRSARKSGRHSGVPKRADRAKPSPLALSASPLKGYEVRTSL